MTEYLNRNIKNVFGKENFFLIAGVLMFILIEPFNRLIMEGVAEADEAHYGKGDNSQMVQGVLQRKGHAVVYPIRDRTEETLKGNIQKF